MDTSTGQSTGHRVRVLVIGAGFGGIGAAVALLRDGVDDVLVVEAGDDVGGVWAANTYPGCASDVPAPLYCYSFAPNPHWSGRFPPQPEIQRYLRDVVDRFGVRPVLRLGTRVTAARWREGSRTWLVEFDGRDGPAPVVADVLVSAVGQLSRPHVPVLPGIERFAGPVWHSARWRHDVRLEGRRVAVVGTGASAVQFVPELAPLTAHLTVVQRSAPWTLPRPERRYGRVLQGLARRRTGSLRLRRGLTYAMTAWAGQAVLGRAVPLASLRAASALQRRVQVRDAALRARVTPVSRLGCRRVLFTSAWLPALTRPDVTLVTDPVLDVVPDAIRTVAPDGAITRHPCDAIVYGTGFTATSFLAPIRVTGRAGADLHAVWEPGARAYLGMAVPGFPNLFLVYGPNTNTGHTSVVLFHEAQARYLVQAVRHLRRHPGAALEVRPEVDGRYDAELQERLAASVWTTCTSWYRTATGRVVTNWPGTAARYRRRTRRFDPADYLPEDPVSAPERPA